jgi:Leucine-rich repeat (LRR) protein
MKLWDASDDIFFGIMMHPKTPCDGRSCKHKKMYLDINNQQLNQQRLTELCENWMKAHRVHDRYSKNTRNCKMCPERKTFDLSPYSHSSWRVNNKFKRNGDSVCVESCNINNELLEEISQNALSRMPNLYSLYLGKNQISDISPSIGSSLNLVRRLCLDKNQITDITSIAGSMLNLKELYLSNNQIRYITSIGSLKKLERLSFDNNDISDITSIGSLKNLEYLCLDNNDISDITSIGSLSKLEILGLLNNRITDIESLATLKNLFALDLRNNRIWKSQIPPNVKLKLTDLKIGCTCSGCCIV